MADQWSFPSLAAARTALVMWRSVAGSRPGWTGIWKVVAISASACVQGQATGRT